MGMPYGLQVWEAPRRLIGPSRPLHLHLLLAALWRPRLVIAPLQGAAQALARAAAHQRHRR